VHRHGAGRGDGAGAGALNRSYKQKKKPGRQSRLFYWLERMPRPLDR
jgi:hypothetical protein